MRISIGYSGATPIPQTLPAVDLAEAIGLNAVSSAEHVGMNDAIVPSAVYAARTQQIEITAMGLNPDTRSPGVLAMELAGLNAIAPGRIRTHIGMGSPQRARQLGVTKPRTVRGVQTFIETLRALLRGETTTAHSEAFSLDAMRITTIDTTLPPIPIDVMAIRPRMTMLAARLGDGLSLSVGASHEYIRSQIALVQRVLDENGRDREAFRVSASVICSIDTDIAAARAGLAQSAVSFPLSTMPELHTGLELPSPQALAEAKALGGVERAAALFRPETVDGLGLVATPETLNVALDRYREDGLDEIIVLLAGPPNKHPALIRALAAASEASTAGHPPISVARVPRVGARG